MTKHRWKDLKKSLSTFISPEKKEELRKIQLENEEKRGKIMKLIKSVNHGNKDAVSKKKSELIKLIDDFQQKYQFLYALYDNVTSEIGRVGDTKDDDSAESSGSESSSGVRSSPVVRRFQSVTKLKNDTVQESEDGYLKDKLSSTSEVVEETIDSTQEHEKIIRSPEGKDELSLLKEDLVKSEEKIQSITNEYEVYKKETTARIKELEGQVLMMKLEVDTMESEKTKVEKQLRQLQDNNSQLHSHEIEIEEHSEAKTEKSVADGTDLQSEVTVLDSQTVVLERSQSNAEGLDVLMEGKVSNVQVKDSSEAHKRVFEEQIRMMINDTNQSRETKEKFHEKIVELEKRSRERENELLSQLQASEAGRNLLSEENVSLASQLSSLQQELKSLQAEKSELCLQIDKAHEESQNASTLKNQNSRLTEEVEDQQKTLNERQVIIDKYNEENKQCEGKNKDINPYVQLVERKIEEAAEGLRKQLEDNLRILSRRIRVAEQLHVENKDFCLKTKETYEENKKELELCQHALGDFSVSVSHMANALDTAVSRFEECNANFMNRISQVSCALIFAKDWMRRKNSTIKHMKEDLDSVLKQRDDKESEILGLREKVWMLENKVRKVEKLVKQKEEGMLSLGEEKREAIRQLCVWMDYHRSRCDYLKKLISNKSQRA